MDGLTSTDRLLLCTGKMYTDAIKTNAWLLHVSLATPSSLAVVYHFDL